MARWQRYGRGDTQVLQDGDAYFKGIDMLHDRAIVQPNYLTRSENKRLFDGIAATRPGTSMPSDFNPDFANVIIGAGIFSNPNGDEVMLVAELDATYVWQLQYGKDPIKIDLHSGHDTGTNPLGGVEFVQAFDKVLLLRRPNPTLDPTLVWDGVVGHTFDPVTTPGPDTVIPPTWFAQPFENRVLLYFVYYVTSPNNNQIIMTDVLDYSQYDPANNVFRINAGESDVITSVLPYFYGAIIVFMRHSVHLLENFTIDPTQATQRLLNDKLGSVSIRAPVMIGRDVLFLSQTGAGIYTLNEIIQNQIAVQPVPISRPIQPLIDNIDWVRQTLWGDSAALGDYAYFTIAQQGLSGGCDAMAVYNAATKEWESAPDTWADPAFRINRLLVTLYNNARRLYAIDYAASRIYLMYEGLEDNTNDSSLPVHDIMETRGYVCNEPTSFKRFQRSIIGTRTFDPLATVTAISDGYNEEKVLGTITKNRLKFYPHGHKDFDPDTDDATEPKRQDYSIGNFDNVAIEDFEDLPLGDVTSIPATGVALAGPKQQSLERFQIRQNGRWVSIRIEGNSGQCDVLGVAVEGIPIQESVRAVA